MSSDRDRAEDVVRTFLTGAKKDSTAEESAPLFADGLGLDSLETAELSAVLEDEFGRDPFSEGDMPQTLSELLDFYGLSDSTAAPAH